MADNTLLSVGTGGDTIATDDIGPGVKYQRIKIVEGADGVNDGDISAANPLPVQLSDGTDVALVTAGGLLQVDASGVAVPVTDNAGSLTIDNAALSVTGGGLEATALRVTVASDSTGLLSVDDNAGSLTVDNAALSVTGGGLEATALRVTLASDSTGLLSVDDNAGSLTVDQATASNLNAQVVGAVAHDAADSGNPVKIGGRADTTFQAAVADADRVDALFDVYGQLRTRRDHVNNWSYHENSSSALTDAVVQAAPGVGLSLYVTDIIVSTGAATAFNLFFEEGVTTVLGPYYLEAIAGRGLVISFATPKKITANTALTVTTSAAIAHAIDITGFIAP